MPKSSFVNSVYVQYFAYYFKKNALAKYKA